MQERYILGGPGGMLPQKNLGAMRLLLRPFLCQYDACRRPEDRVSHECHSAHCVVHHWCRLSNLVHLLAVVKILFSTHLYHVPAEL